MGPQVGEVARQLGTPLLPWQQLVADVGLEVDPESGLPAYREVWFTVMRQSGKTSLALPWEVHRCIAPVWGGPQRVAYTAQTGWEAKTKLLEDQAPILEGSPLAGLVAKVRRAQGDWGVNFTAGSKIDVLGSTSSAGHGRTIDLGVIDEAWRDEDDRREQAILPAMVTRAAGQLLGFSTQGTDASVYLNRKVEMGREAAAMDSGSGLAYFEWSIPDDADIDDPEVWWQFMPALGWTISEAAVRHARETMTDDEFRRAFGNQRTSGAGERVVPHDAWDAVQDPAAEPSGRVVVGVDVNEDRASASVCAAGGGAVELVKTGGGTGWLVPWLSDAARSDAIRDAEVVVDGDGPAVPVAQELEGEGVKVRRLSSSDVAAACGRMYDAIADQHVAFRPSREMDEAVAGLAKRPMGDRFAWSRKNSTADATPFIAATLAYSRDVPPPEPFVFVT